jgi:hypothetical protein
MLCITFGVTLVLFRRNSVFKGLNTFHKILNKVGKCAACHDYMFLMCIFMNIYEVYFIASGRTLDVKEMYITSKYHLIKN